MCIFCQVVDGQLPSRKVYEDDQVLAILDIQPVNPGHVVIITKEHVSNIEEASDGQMKAIILAAKKVGRLLKDKLGAPGYNITTNNDPISGQVIPHIHFHVIPRHEGDGHGQWTQKEYAAGEADEVLKKLTS